jgi:hypothetical protein
MARLYARHASGGAGFSQEVGNLWKSEPYVPPYDQAKPEVVLREHDELFHCKPSATDLCKKNPATDNPHRMLH